MTEELKQPLLSQTHPAQLHFSLNSQAILPENAMTSVLEDLNNTDSKLLGHTKKIFSVRVSKDSKYLVSGSKDNSVKLWSLEKKHEVFTFRGHTDIITSVLPAQSTSSYQHHSYGDVYSASKDATIKHWRSSSPEDVTTFIGHDKGVNSIDLDFTERFLVSGSDDSNIIIWDTNKVTALFKLEGHEGSVNCVRFFEEGKFVVSGSDDKTIKVWNTETKALAYTCGEHSGSVLSVDQSGKFIASGCSSGQIYVWQDSNKVHVLDKESGRAVRSVRFNKSRNFLVSAGDEHFIHIWSLERNAKETSIFAHEQPINCIDISENQQFIVSASNDNSLGVWRLKRGLEDFTIDRHESAVTAISACSKNDLFVTGSEDSSVKLWDLERKTLVKDLGKLEGSITCTCISNNAKYCISGSSSGEIIIWSLIDYTPIAKKNSEKVPKSISMSRSDSFFVIGFKAERESKKSSVFVYSTSTFESENEYSCDKSSNTVSISDKLGAIIVGNSAGNILKFSKNDIENSSIKAHEHKITSSQLDDEKNLLYTASFDYTIKMWRVTDLSHIFTFQGHSNKVLSLGLGIQGRYLVSGSSDKLIKVWNTVEKREEFSLNLHSAEVLATVFSSKDKFIISGSRDSTIKLWETQENTKAKRFHIHSKTITCVGSSPDGRLGISGSDDQKIMIWDLHKGEVKDEFELNDKKNVTQSTPLCLEVSQDGKMFAVGSSDKRIYLFGLDNIESHTKNILKGHVGEVNCLVITHNNMFLFSGSSDHTIRKWCLGMHKEVQIFRASLVSVLSISLSSSNVHLLSGSSDGKVKCYNLTKSHEIASIDPSNSPIVSVLFTRDEFYGVVGSQDGRIHLWDLNTYHIVYSIRLHNNLLKCMALSSCNKYIYTGSADHTIKIWNIRDQYEEFTIKAHLKPVTCIHVNPINSLIISGSEDEMINLWASKGRFFEKYLQGHSLEIHAVASSQSYIATASGDKTIKLWNSRNLTEEGEFKEHKDRVFCLVFTNDGRKLISGSRDCNVIIWDVGQKTLIKVLEGHTEAVNAVICIDDEFIVSGSNDKTLMVWNIKTGEEEFVLTGHNGPVLSLAFCKEDKLIASGSTDKCVKVWSFAKRKLKRTLIAHNLAIQALCFTSDGKFLISGSNDTTLKIWDLVEKKIHKNVNIFSSPILSAILTRNNDYIILALADNTIQVIPFTENARPFTLKKLDTSIKSICLSEDEDRIFAGLDKPQLYATDFNKRLRSAGLSSQVYENFIENETKKLIPTYLSNFQNFIRFYNIFYCLKYKDYSKLSPNSSGVQVSKYNFTYTHFLCYYGQGAVLKKLISDDFALRADIFGHSAFYYAISKQDQQCVDVLLEFMIQLGSFTGRSVLSTSFNAIQEDFKLIIQNSSQYLPQFLGVLLNEQKSEGAYAQPRKSLPMTQYSQNHSVTKNSFPLKFVNHSKLRTKHKKVREKQLKFLTSALKLPDTNGTSSSLSLLESISKCDNGLIFKTDFIKYYISHKFDSLRPLAYFLAGVLFVNIIITVCLIIYSSSNIFVLVPFLAVNAFLFLWEMIQLRGAKLSYFLDLLNLIDISRLSVSVAFVVFDWFSKRYLILTWFMLAINLIRGFSALRIFDGTRHYTKLLEKSLRNIFYFLIVFVYCTISFGLVLNVSSESEFSFSNTWMFPYELALGINSIKSIEEANITYMGFIFLSVVNVMILMNLLIAILGDTYDEFLTQKEIVEGREKVEMILEIEQILYTFVSRSNSISFLQVCDKSSKNEEKWKGKILYLEKEIKKQLSLVARPEKPVHLDQSPQPNTTFQAKVESIEDKINAVAIRFDNQLNKLYRLHKSSAGTHTPKDSLDKFVLLARESISEAFSGRLAEEPGELSSRMDEFEGNFEENFRQQSLTVQSVKQDLIKLNDTMKKKLDNVMKESENTAKVFEEQLVKNRKKIDESIRTKIEEKMSSLEANIQNKISNSVGAIDKNVGNVVENSEENLKVYIEAQIENLKETIFSKLEKLESN